MKRRFMVILLASGLMLELWGCGSSGDSAAEAPVPAPVEDVSVPEESEAVQEVVQELEINEGAEPTDSEPAEPEAEPEDSTVSGDIDLSVVMTRHVLENTDFDGYRTQETVYLSPIFRESNMDALMATWEALGGNADEIPIGEECYSWNSKLQRSLERSGFSGAQYIVGSWEIMNCTEG